MGLPARIGESTRCRTMERSGILGDTGAPLSRPALQDGGLVYVVEEHANPPSDYFVYPLISANGSRVVRCRAFELLSPAGLLGAVVVFVRYVADRWAKLVESVRPQLRHLVLL